MSRPVDETKYRGRKAANQPVRACRDGLEYRLNVRRRTGNDLEDVGRRGLSLQRFLRLIEQSGILDGDDGLIGKALLERKLLGGEGYRFVAVNDERADRLAVVPEWGPCQCAGAGGTRGRQAGPISNRRIDMVEVGNVDLPVLAQYRAGQVVALNIELCIGKLRADGFRGGTDTDGPSPSAVPGDMQRDAWRAEQARGGLGDLLQRLFGVARRARDGTQDFGTAVLAVVGGLELVLKLGDPAPEIGHHVMGKRGHWFNPPRPVPVARNSQKKSVGAIRQANIRLFHSGCV